MVQPMRPDNDFDLGRTEVSDDTSPILVRFVRQEILFTALRETRDSIQLCNIYTVAAILISAKLWIQSKP